MRLPLWRHRSPSPAPAVNKAVRRRRRWWTLSLEPLEDRTLLSITSASIISNTLTVVADGANDTLSVRLKSGDSSKLEVVAGGTVYNTFNTGNFAAIDIDAGAGNDAVTVDQGNGSFTTKSITLRGNAGNDTLTAGSGPTTLLGGAGTDQFSVNSVSVSNTFGDSVYNLLAGVRRLIVGDINDPSFTGYVYARQLPLISNAPQAFQTLATLARIGGVPDVINSFYNPLHTALNGLSTTSDIQEVLYTTLGPAPDGVGLLKHRGGAGNPTIDDVVVASDTVSGHAVLTFDVLLHHDVVTDTDGTADLNLDLPGLPLTKKFTKHGGVQVGVGFDYDLRFGINASTGTFIDKTNTDPLQIQVHAQLVPDTADPLVTDRYHDAGATLGLLNVDLRDDVAHPTHLDAVLHVNFKPDGTVATGLVTTALVANFVLVTSATGTINPVFTLNFHLDWAIGQSGPESLDDGHALGTQPTVQLNHVQLSAQSFFQNFLKPVLDDQILPMFDTIEPLVKIFDYKFPVLHFGVDDLLDNPLYNVFGNITAFFQGINQLTLIRDNFPAPFSVDTLIDLGSVTINQDVRQAGPIDPAHLTTTPPATAPLDQLRALNVTVPDIHHSTVDLQDALTFSFQYGLSQNFGNATYHLMQFPMLSDPGNVFNMMLGLPGKLLDWDLPPAAVAFTGAANALTFPLEPPPLMVILIPNIQFLAHFAGGFDSFGVEQGFGNFDEGYFLNDTVPSEVVTPDINTIVDQFTPHHLTGSFMKLNLNFGIDVGTTTDALYGKYKPAGAILKALKSIFDFSIGMGITISSDTYWNTYDPTADGKLRPHDSALDNDPANGGTIWNTAGDWFFGFNFFIKVKLFGIPIVNKLVNLASFKLADFTQPPRTITVTPLAHMDVDGSTLVLNMTSGDDTFQVRHFADEGGGLETVRVMSQGRVQDFPHVRKITADGGNGNDTIVVREGATSPVSLVGGDGNDHLEYQGSGNATLVGGNGDDQLISSSGDDVLDGGVGNDYLDADGGQNTIQGGTGSDTLESGQGRNVLYGTNANPASGSAADTDLYDNIVGTAVTVYGSAANDVVNVFLGGGNRFIDGGLGGADDIAVRGSSNPDDIRLASTTWENRSAVLVNTPDANFGSVTVSRVASLDVSGGDGADQFTVNDLSASGLSFVNLSMGAAATPDGFANHVLLKGTTGNDTLTFDLAHDPNSGAGSPVGEMTGLSYAVRLFGLQPALDTVTLAGGGGNDTLAVGATAYAPAGGNSINRIEDLVKTLTVTNTGTDAVAVTDDANFLLTDASVTRTTAVPGSNPTQLTDVGGSMYFTATDLAHGQELWKSNGIAVGTSLVGDIRPGSAGSAPTELTPVGTTLYFVADDGTHGAELWKTDGTSTTLVKDINPGATGSAPDHLTAVGTTLYFVADDGTHGTELWKSDGTDAGTVFVKDIAPSGGSSPSVLTNVAGTLFFAANDGIHGSELWKSDGSDGGTVLVLDINPAASASPHDLFNFSGTLFFAATDPTHGAELWKSDGTAGGTVLVKDINPGTEPAFGPAGSSPGDFTTAGNALYFVADDGTHGTELWTTDGTPGGTALVRDINPGGGSAPSWLTDVGGTLFFAADDGQHVTELWKSDGTAGGTVLVKNINPAGPSSPIGLVALGGLLFFTADDGTHGAELWRSDGTDAGTVLIKDIFSGAVGSFPANLTTAGGKLFFAAADGIAGSQLWSSGGIAANTALVKNIDGGPANQITLTSIEAADLTGGTGDNSFDVSAWSGTGTISGQAGNDTVVATNSQNFTLTATQLQRTGRGALTLDNTVENVNLTGDGGNNDFTVNQWVGTANLLGLGGTNRLFLTTAGGTVVNALDTLILGDTVTGTAGTTPAYLNGSINLNSATRIFDLAQGTAPDADLIVTATLQGGGVYKQGAGTLKLAPATSNTYAGNTTVHTGSLLVSKDLALGTTAGATYVDSGATLGFEGNVTYAASEPLFVAGIGDAGNGRQGAIDNITGANAFACPVTVVAGAPANDGVIGASAGVLTVTSPVIDNGGLTLGLNPALGTTITVNSVIQGSGGLRKDGAGKAILAGAAPNTYTGLTYVNAGILALEKDGALGDFHTGTIVGAGGTLALEGGLTYLTPEPITLSGNLGSLLTTPGTNSYYGPITLPGPATAAAIGAAPTTTFALYGNIYLGAAANSLTLTGAGFVEIHSVINGAGSLVKADIGTATFYLGNNYTGTTDIQGGTLNLNWDNTLGSVQGGTAVELGATLGIQGISYTGAEPLILAGGTLANLSGASTLRGPVAVTGPSTVTNLSSGVFSLAGDVSLGGALTFTGSGATSLGGTLSGTGGLVKTGTGSLTLLGKLSNTYTGGTQVGQGTLFLSKTPGKDAIPGTLSIGTAGTTTVATVQSLAGNQINDGTVVTLLSPAATLNLAGQNDTVGGLDFTGGSVATGTGTLTLAGSVNTHDPGTADFASIAGNLALGAATRNFAVANGSAPYDLVVTAQVTSGGIAKTGPGTLKLAGSTPNTVSSLGVAAGVAVLANTGNAFSGAVALTGGPVQLGAANQFPDNSSLNLTSATLDLNGYSDTVGPLALTNATVTSGSGTLTLGGNVTSDGTSSLVGNVALPLTRTFAVNSGSLKLDAVLSGAGGLTKTGDGTTLELGGSANAGQPNTFGGAVQVNAGTLLLNKQSGINAVSGSSLTIGDGTSGAAADQVRLTAPDQIRDMTAVTVASSGKLDLQGYNETVGPLTLTAASLTTGGGNLSLGGDVTVSPLAVPSTSTITGNIVLSTTRTVTVAANTTLILDGAISQTLGAKAGLVKAGTGVLQLGGTVNPAAANSYSGLTLVNAGTLQLAKNAAVDAIFGDLAIGDGSGGAAADLVVETASGQIDASSNVTVNSSGRWTLSGTPSQTVASLTLAGGSVTGGGTVKLAGNVTSGNNSSVATTVDLNGQTRTFTVNSGTLVLTGKVTGTGGVTKAGPGTLKLASSGAGNDFTGAAAVSGGVLLAGGNDQLPGDLSVGSGATFDLGGAADTVGALTVNGGTVSLGTGTLTTGGTLSITAGTITASGAGALVLGGDVTTAASAASATIKANLSLGGVSRTFTVADGAATDDLVINGAVRATAASAGLTKAGAGALKLTGAAANTYTGLTDDAAGILRLAKSTNITAVAGSLRAGGTVQLQAAGQVADTAAVTLGLAGTLDLGTYSETVGAVTLQGGQVTGTTGVLTLGGNVTATGSATVAAKLALGGSVRTFDVAAGQTLTLSGGVSGSSGAGLMKTGAGTLVLASNASYLGSTVVSAGILQVNATVTGDVIVSTSGASYGTLTGSGKVAKVTVSGGVIDPGAGTGILQAIGNVTLDATSTLHVDAGGTTAGTDYDQLKSSGTVTLGSAALTLGLTFDPVAGNTFTIVQAAQVTGKLSFGGTLLNDGATFQVQNPGTGHTFTFRINYTAKAVTLTRV